MALKVSPPLMPKLPVVAASTVRDIAAPTDASHVRAIDAAATLESVRPQVARGQRAAPATPREPPELAADELQHELREVTQTLRAGAALETVRYALRKLVADFEARGAPGAKAAVMRACAAVPESLASARDPLDEVRALLAPDIANGTIVASELDGLLLGIFERHRQGQVFREDFALGEPEALLAPKSPAPRTTRRVGLSPSVLAVRADARHSIHDLGDYIDDRLGSFIVRDLVSHRRVLELHTGTREETFASLYERGFRRIVRVHAPKASQYNQIYLAQSRTGELRYVVTEIYVSDRLRHFEHLVRHAVVDGKRIESRQLEVYAAPTLDRIDAYRHYSRALLRAGPVPDAVVVGFKNSIQRELQRRQQAADKLAFLRDWLAANPGQALGEVDAILERLGSSARLASTLTLGHSDILAHATHTRAVEDLEAALVLLAKEPSQTLSGLIRNGALPTPGGAVSMDVGNAFLDEALTTYVDHAGQRRVLLLARTPYGDATQPLVDAAVDRGVERLVLFGTAGGLRPGAHVGDIEIPGSTASSTSTTQRFVNALSQLTTVTAPATDAAPMRAGGSTYSVDTPLEETMARIEALRVAGYAVVDVEAAELVTAATAQAHKPELGVAQVVSDLPGTRETLEDHVPSPRVDRAVATLVDMLVEHLAMERLERGPEVSATPAEKRTALQAAMGVAGRMMTGAGVAVGDHELMRYNLARYLINGTSADGLAYLHDKGGTSLGELEASHLVSERWHEKIARAMVTPFRNEEVLTTLARLGERLRGLVRFIETQAKPGTPYRLYLLGSFTKGRLAAGSDLDVLLQTEDKALENAVADSEYGYRGATDDSLTVGLFSYAAARLDFYRPPIDIGDGKKLVDDPAALEKLYCDTAATYGVHIARQGGALQVRFDAGRTADGAERETPQAAEQILEHEKRYRKLMRTDFVTRYLQQCGDYPELETMPLVRLVDVGEDLVTALAPRLDAARLSAYLQGLAAAQWSQSEAGGAYLARKGVNHASDLDAASVLHDVELFRLVPLDDVPDLLGARDAVEALGILFAGAERRLKNGDSGKPFARELAQQAS